MTIKTILHRIEFDLKSLWQEKHRSNMLYAAELLYKSKNLSETEMDAMVRHWVEHRYPN